MHRPGGQHLACRDTECLSSAAPEPPGRGREKEKERLTRNSRRERRREIDVVKKGVCKKHQRVHAGSGGGGDAEVKRIVEGEW